MIKSCSSEAKLFFHSGFDDGITISNTGITGRDTSLPAPNSWDGKDGLQDGKYFSDVCNIVGNGDGETITDYDTINPKAFYGIDKAKDPANLDNNVLRFSINAMPTGDTSDNARLEHVVWGKREKTQEVYYKFDMYLSPDFKQFDNYPDEITWMMILEFWNETNWLTSPYPYRVSVDLYKPSGLNQPFRIRTRASISGGWFTEGGDWWYKPNCQPPEEYTIFWEFAIGNEWETVSADHIPLGQWISCEVYYKAGGRGEGEFYFAGTTQDGKKLVFCDKTGPDKGETCEDNRVATRHPQSPYTLGVEQFNPFKLYVHETLVRYIDGLNVRNIEAGKPTNYAIEVLWDNLEYWNTGVT